MYLILMAVDGSEHADRAIDAVARLPREPGALEVVLMNVSNPLYYGELPPVAMDEVEPVRRMTQERLLDTAAKLARSHGLTVKGCHGVSGHVPTEIGAMARETGADQIAMGSRGMGAMGSLFVGSVALAVVHLAHVPVLLVK